MERAEIRRFRRKLDSDLEEALQFMKQLEIESYPLQVDSPQDSADRSITTLSKEAIFQQTSQRRMLFRMIEIAFQRIRDGTFWSLCLLRR
jgi:RNA polymerase-binding transcription factor DksA